MDCYPHPGIGIVKDSKGNIYYTDLEHVWKINSKSQKKIAVPNVHTHDLYIDDQDNLYGQHSWYYGEALNKWGHYVWRLNPQAQLDTVVDPTEGFNIENFSFAHDREGNIYWIRQWKEDKLMKTLPDQTSIELASGNFKNVQWLKVIDNTLFFIQEDNVMKWDGNQIKPVALGLAGKDEAHNSIFGLWSDGKNNIYVANTDKHKIQVIDSLGVVKDYYTSKDKWLITGGVFDEQGHLWVLEYLDNRARARKITDKKASTSMKKPVFISILSIGLLSLCWIIYTSLQRFSFISARRK
jgi:sugar lactone lactonase YvrE